jgi:hypothetical protein
MSDQTDSPVTIDEATTNVAEITNLPSAAQTTLALTNMAIDTTAPDTDTDSTGSVPDLEPVTDGESDNNLGEHHPLPVVPIDTRTVNGFVNPNQSIVRVS